MPDFELERFKTADGVVVIHESGTFWFIDSNGEVVRRAGRVMGSPYLHAENGTNIHVREIFTTRRAALEAALKQEAQPAQVSADYNTYVEGVGGHG